jgi:hypothetical protein
MRMINDDEKKRAMAKRSKKPQEIKKKAPVKKPQEIKKKAPVKKTVGWQYNSKTGRYEPTLAKSKRQNF